MLYRYILAIYLAKAYNFIKKETLAQVFSCECCEISKNIFFYRTLPVAVSDQIISNSIKKIMKIQ